MQELKFKKLNSSAIIPTQADSGSNGYDLYCLEDLLLPARTPILAKTGLALEIPDGICGMICSRSGLALKNSIFVLNSPGIVDSSYRNEVGVILYNGAIQCFHIKKHSRIAQILFVKTDNFNFKEVDKLSDTQRTGGFGSTGI